MRGGVRDLSLIRLRCSMTSEGGWNRGLSSRRISWKGEILSANILLRKVNDRRTKLRFPLKLGMRYRALNGAGVRDWRSGESLNFSSTGLLFTSGEKLAPGQDLEALVDWPVRLDNRVPLGLAIRGTIVRIAGDQMGMLFDNYEFRLRHSSDR